MDLISLDRIRAAHDRTELALGPRSAPLAGGTWLFSEPQPRPGGARRPHDAGLARGRADGRRSDARRHLHDPVAGGPAPGRRAGGRSTWCSSARGRWWPRRRSGTGRRSAGTSAWRCPAGALTSLAVALDATAVVWTPDGGERREPVASLVTGVRTTSLSPGEVLRSVSVTAEVLAQPAAFRRVALTRHGRSGAIVVGRRDDARRARRDPHRRRHRTRTASRSRRCRRPTSCRAAVDAVDDWYDDPHGAPDWRRAMTLRLAEQVREELA